MAAAALAGELPPGTWATPDTAELITALSGRGDPAAGRLALALTAAAGRAITWNSPWTEHLRALRQHPDRDLREAALTVSTAPE